jgi:hypothetical protein
LGARILAQNDLTLWLRLRDDNNGRVTDFDERHLLRPWTDNTMFVVPVIIIVVVVGCCCC